MESGCLYSSNGFVFLHVAPMLRRLVSHVKCKNNMVLFSCVALGFAETPAEASAGAAATAHNILTGWGSLVKYKGRRGSKKHSETIWDSDPSAAKEYVQCASAIHAHCTCVGWFRALHKRKGIFWHPHECSTCLRQLPPLF